VIDITATIEILTAMVLCPLCWLVILWLKCKELIPQVQEQLEVVTKRVTQGGRTGLDTHLSVINSELRKVEEGQGYVDTVYCVVKLPTSTG